MKMMKKLVGWVQKHYDKAFLMLCLMATCRLSYAANLIPISSEDQTADGSNVAATIVKILQKDILPLVELGGAAYLLFVAFGGIWKGYHEYQREKEMGPLKNAVIASTIAIVVGGAILFVLDKLRTYTFS